MPIQEENIVFVESQVMDDVPEGGGAATGKIVYDGVMNNVFEDISDLDRAYGRFNLRKIFLAVRTLSTDLFGGVKTVITQLPTDPAVGYTMFTTKDQFDTRTSAASAVESYLYKGTAWQGVLHNDHITGMTAISVLQRLNTPLPPVGKTLCLVQNENLPNETEQYVRVVAVDVETVTFTDSQGDYQRWRVIMTLSDALRFNFNGHVESRYDSYSYTNKCRIRDTSVADATRYYSTKPLAVVANIGDTSVRAESMFTQLVPSAQTETPLVAQTLNSLAAYVTSTASGNTTKNLGTCSCGAGQTVVLPTGCTPGSLNLTVAGYTFTDDSQGVVLQGSTVRGTIDYITGQILFTSGTVYTGASSVTYIPATRVTQQPHTMAQEVTAENRRLNWLPTLTPLPAPSTISVSFMAQGNWYTLTDNGQGNFAGLDPSHGAGTINYVTGDVNVTLGELPDAGSQVVFTWGSPVHHTIRTGTVPGKVVIQLPDEQVARNTITVDYIVAETPAQATDDGSGNLLRTGDLVNVGNIHYTSGRIELTVVPDKSSDVTVTYDIGNPIVETFIDPARELNGTVIVSPVTTPIEPHSISVRWNTDIELYDPELRAPPVRRDPIFIATDDGLGNLKLDNGSVIGSVNYSTGAIQFMPDQTISMTVLNYGWVAIGGGWTQYQFLGFSYVPAAAIAPPTFDVQVTYRTTDSPTVRTHTQVPVIEIDMTPNYLDEIVPGSVMFLENGDDYIDREGIIYTNIDHSTGTGLEVGTIDYANKLVNLTYWESTSLSFTVQSCLTRYGDYMVARCSFRTPVAPLKPEAISVVATDENGNQLIVTGNADGDMICASVGGEGTTGRVEYELGVCEIDFKDSNGDPVLVDPDTIRYNAVAYSYLPLDAEILGIDAVRLPSDGRVPIYRKGDVAFICNTQDTAPTAIVDGSIISAGRTRLAYVRLLDANGDAVSSTKYELDRDNGLITIPDATGIAQPVTLRHTVGDLRMITDAQISGDLTLSRQLTHEYPLENSFVCACLLQGDRRARVSITFDQETWDGATWLDYLTGDPATATLNLIDFPIEVTNEGCDTDRWILQFGSSTSARLISERRGQVWPNDGSTYASFVPGGADIAPINPRSAGPDGSTHYCDYDNAVGFPFTAMDTVQFSGGGNGIITTVEDNGNGTGTLYFRLDQTPAPADNQAISSGLGVTAQVNGTVTRNGTPYMIIKGASNGGGWQSGNVIRINTVGAIADIWMARSIQQSDEPVGDGADGCEVYALGNIDRP